MVLMQPPPNFFAPYPEIRPLNKSFMVLLFTRKVCLEINPGSLSIQGITLIFQYCYKDKMSYKTILPEKYQ